MSQEQTGSQHGSLWQPGHRGIIENSGWQITVHEPNLASYPFLLIALQNLKDYKNHMDL